MGTFSQHYFVSEWHKSTIELPTQKYDVLVYFEKDGFFRICSYSSDYNLWDDCELGPYPIKDTYWCYLKKPVIEI